MLAHDVSAGCVEQCAQSAWPLLSIDVEDAVRGDPRQQLAQRRASARATPRHAGVRLARAPASASRTPARCRCRRPGGSAPCRRGAVVLQVAVVREHPVAAPQLAHERVRVLERDRALRGLADVGDDVVALDRVARAPSRRPATRARSACRRTGARPCPRRRRCRSRPCAPSARVGEAGEAEHHVGRRVGVHAEQLAHGGR